MKKKKGEQNYNIKEEFPLRFFYSHLLQVLFGLQAPSSAAGLDDFTIRIQTFGEALVLAAVPSGTDLRMTLVLQHAVQTLRVLTAWPLVCGFTVAAGDLGEIGDVHLHLANRLIGLR